MEKNKNSNSHRNLTLSGWLLFVLITALILTGVSFAEFISAARGKADARVASFVVNAVGSGNEALRIDCSDPDTLSAEYSIQITNEKDGRLTAAAAEYRIVVTLPQALPQGVVMTLHHPEGEIAPTTADGNIYSYAGAEALTPREKDVHNYTLRFAVTDPALIREAVSLSGIRIEVLAEQVN